MKKVSLCLMHEIISYMKQDKLTSGSNGTKIWHYCFPYFASVFSMVIFKLLK